MKYYSHKKAAGFSLVETLVAVSIVLIVIVGPMTLSSRTAKSSTFATEQVQAYFLAQEGLELVQKLRDEYTLQYFTTPQQSATPWASFKTAVGTCSGVNGCGLVWDTEDDGELNTPVSCSGTSCRLYVTTDEERSRYNHTAVGEITPFTRKIFIEIDSSPTVANREVYVRSEVTWRTGSLISQQKVQAETYLFNIYDLP